MQPTGDDKLFPVGTGIKQHRPIKFRFWDFDNQKMLYYDPLAGAPSVMTWTGILYKDGVALRAKPLQYIGETDENNVEIYEHDIIRRCWAYKSNRKGIICDNYEYHLIVLDDRYGWALEGIANTIKWSKVKVVGNLYENKALLDI